MAEISVPDFVTAINELIETQEAIECCINKLNALTTVARLSEGFFEASDGDILQSYMWVINDLIDQAYEANQASLHQLIRQLRPSAEKLLNADYLRYELKIE